MFDFNNAAPQQSHDLIPAKTFAKVSATIRPGKSGQGGWATKSSTGFKYLSMEFTVVSAPMAKRKIFQNAGIGGITEGHEKAADITRTFLRSLLESARGIDPKDESDKARKVRVIESWGDLVELEFAVEIGIEKGKDGYADKNKIARVITPDHKMYKQIMAGETILPTGVAAPANAAAPAPHIAAAAQETVKAGAVPAWAR
jgi:hypothetical protein